MRVIEIELQEVVKSTVQQPIPWKEMTRDQKRIRVAQEVLELINDGTVLPSGTGEVVDRLYCKVADDEAEFSSCKWRKTPHFEDVCEAITKKRKQKKCTACAVGALMIGTLLSKGKFDDCSIVPKKLAGAELDEREVSVDVIRGVFSEHELAVIELCYEGISSPSDSEVADNRKLYNKCTDFACAIPKENRIQLLMQSIIDNDGKLVVPSVD